MMGLVDYASDGSEQEPSDEEQVSGARGTAPAQEDSEDSYFVASESESEDSAGRRAREARERLDAMDGPSSDDETTGPSVRPQLLPDPLAAIDALQGKPGYLDPDATRPIAAPIHSTLRRPTVPGDPGPEGGGAEGGGAKGSKRAAEWDISMMAPPLKGQPGQAKVGVISAAAKLKRPAGEEEEGIVTAAQVAMLGGQWKPSSEAEGGGGGPEGPAAGSRLVGPARPQGEPKDRLKRATKAMPVADALASGAALPRRQQGLKERQKAKAEQGKRATGEWKSEAFMILRQQYD